MGLFKKEKGFTLVELLVVLAIVGILIALAIGGIRIVQQVNRDDQRKALLRDMTLVLEAYQEKYNSYPDTMTVESNSSTGKVTITAGEDTVNSEAYFETDSFTVGDCSGYPTGTKESNAGQATGCYEAEGQGYWLFVQLERASENHNVSSLDGTPSGGSEITPDPGISID